MDLISPLGIEFVEGGYFLFAGMRSCWVYASVRSLVASLRALTSSAVIIPPLLPFRCLM